MALGVALVTGAGRGIGRAIALRLAKDGYNVALNDVGHKGKLTDLQWEIESLGRSSIGYVADVSKESEVKEMVKQTVATLGGLDVMVANAGMSFTKPLMHSTISIVEHMVTTLTRKFKATLEDWDKVFNLNGKGVFLCYKYAAEAMIQQGRGGRIIGASSIAGKQGMNLLTLYSASKFTVRSLTQTAAIELKPYSITVNAYAPGLVQTPLGEEYKEDMKKWGQNPEGVADVGKPEEIAALVSYLASKEARYITGQSVSINGGLFFD